MPDLFLSESTDYVQLIILKIKNKKIIENKNAN